MTPTFRTTLSSLLEPFLALGDPSKRIFWPFLLGALCLGAAVSLRAEGGPAASLLRLLSRRVWLHPSAILDYKLLFTKAILRAAIFGPLLLSTLAVAAAVAVWLRDHLGAAPMPSASAAQVLLLYTVAALLADDWSRYRLHRLMHRVPWLWELHKVHHSAEVLTPITLYRTHPLESALFALRGTLVLGATTGLFVWLFGQRVQGFEVLGVDAVGFVWSLLGANLRHSQVWLSYGPRWERLLISPAQHQVHHSDDPRHGDANFGTILALWDWLGGTLYLADGRERPRFGLPASAKNHGPTVASVLVSPVVAAAQAAGRSLAARWARPAPTRATTALGVLLLLSACPSKRLDRGALLQAFGDCTLALYRDFDRAAGELATTTSAAADSPSDASRAAAREAWTRAIDLWQQAEAHQYGPAAAAPSPGAQGLREALYAWPNLNRCLLEQQLLSKVYEGDLISAVPEGTRGLAALEYLLFYTGTDNACGAAVSINAQGTWAALGADELARRKGAYARAAAADVRGRARALVAAWEAGPAGFLVQLTTAGMGSTVLASQHGAVSAVGDALFYVETMVKDRKLGQPLGLRDCPKQSCPEALESPFAERGRTHLRQNLLGFRKLFLGCGEGGVGLGFDDLLVSAGAADLSGRMSADLDAALAATEALSPQSLREALATNSAGVLRIYDAAKRLGDALKGEFIVTLQITPPQRVEGDQD